MKKIILVVLFLIFLGQFQLVDAQTNPQPQTANNTTSKSNVACTKVGNPAVSKPNACGGGGSQAFPGFSGDVNVVYYCQGNTQWQNNCSLGLAGCGPSSMAMVLSSFGVTMIPPEVDREWGFRGCGGNFGSSMEAAIKSQWLKDKGFEYGPGLISGDYLDAQLAKKFLDDKWLIIGSSHQFPCANCRAPGTTVDHIFVVDGVDVNNNNASIRDPNNCSYADGNDENDSKRIKSIPSFTWAYAYPIRRVP